MPFVFTPERLFAQGLTLRWPGEADTPHLVTHIRNPLVHRQTGTLKPDYDESDARAFLASLPERRAFCTDFIYAIDDEAGAFCGIVGLHRREAGMPLELGYWVAPPAWGRGVATRAGAALLAWLDLGLGEGASLAVVNIDNPASLRVLHRLGFMLAGRGKRYSRGRDMMMDVHMLARMKARSEQTESFANAPLRSDKETRRPPGA
jgi:RimJ/RimL family protein N-acetyltransferase